MADRLVFCETHSMVHVQDEACVKPISDEYFILIWVK